MEERTAVLSVVNQCNSNCIMCTNDLELDRKKEEIKIQKLFERIDQLGKGTTQITLTGGEPTLQEGLIDFLLHINNRLPLAGILLLSNGRRFSYKAYAEKLMSSGIKNLEIAVPICGHNAELHDLITRTPGSFKQSVNGIKNLLKLGAIIELRVVIHALNYKNLPEIAEFIRDNFKGADRIVFFAMEIQGEAFKNKEKLLVRYKDFVPMLDKVFSTLKEFNLRLYHFPLCKLKPIYWKNAWRTLKARKIKFLESCNKCLYKKYCLGILKTYAVNLGVEEFVPINKNFIITETGNSFNPIKMVK